MVGNEIQGEALSRGAIRDNRVLYQAGVTNVLRDGARLGKNQGDVRLKRNCLSLSTRGGRVPVGQQP